MSWEEPQALRAWRTRIDEHRGVFNHLDNAANATEAALDGFRQEADDIAQAQHIIQEVTRQTQAELEYHISGIVSMAQASVFEDPYEFIARFASRGEKVKTTECRLLFKKEDEEMEPKDASGGGPVDVASFALRVAFLRVERPQSRKILILDEPFGFVSNDLQHKCSKMLKEISEKLGLQVIMVSHKEELIESADRVFSVELDNQGKSQVTEEKRDE